LWSYHNARSGSKNKVATTKHLLGELQRNKRPIIPLTNPVEVSNEKSNLLIEPYTLGVLLGGGSITTENIAKRFGVCGLVDNLKTVGLFGADSASKFIPEEYISASVEDRFNLMQGLFDTACFTSNGDKDVFYTSTAKIKDGVCEILQSLGFITTVFMQGTDFFIHIKGADQNKLFRLDRKKSRTKAKNAGLGIVSIEKICEDYATCISISGDDKLFITTNYIVTHNTFAIILNMVKFAMMRNSTIVLFRRNSTQLRAGGGIWQEACMVFRKLFGKSVKIRDRDLEIILPDYNSTIKFSHLQYQSDVNNHLGSQYSVIFFDEATTFPFEEMILPLLGRLRNANVSYTPQMFWATNPSYDHGIYHWIKDYYLDSDGIPLKERSNIERYFVLQNNKPVWFEKLEDAQEIYGTSSDNGVRSFRSIRAHVTDNIPLLKANPDYLSNLKALPDIKRKIYLDGSWTAREEEAGFYRRSFTEIVNHPNVLANKRVRAWDTAAILPSSATPDPDWTRGVLLSRDKHGYITIEDIASLRDRPHKVEELIYQCARNDPEGTIVGLNVDPGSAGLAYVDHIRKNLAEMGVYCKVIRSQKGKLQRFLPFSALAESGFTRIVHADWNEDLFDEAERFNGQRNNGHDDICDAISLGVEVLLQGNVLPDFDIKALVGSNIQAPIVGLGINTNLSANLGNLHNVNKDVISIHGNKQIPSSGMPYIK
jgi:predicted phage terminase large subunit-like protein